MRTYYIIENGIVKPINGYLDTLYCVVRTEDDHSYLLIKRDGDYRSIACWETEDDALHDLLKQSRKEVKAARLKLKGAKKQMVRFKHERRKKQNGKHDAERQNDLDTTAERTDLLQTN